MVGIALLRAASAIKTLTRPQFSTTKPRRWIRDALLARRQGLPSLRPRQNVNRKWVLLPLHKIDLYAPSNPKSTRQQLVLWHIHRRELQRLICADLRK